MKITSIALLTLALSGNAWAQEAQCGHSHWWMELSPSWYAGAALGQSSFKDWGAIGDFNDGSFTSATADDSDSAWRVFAGADLGRYVALEVGYADFGEATSQAQSDGSGSQFAVGPQSVGLEFQAWDLAVVGKLPLSTELALVGKLGASSWETASRVSVNRQCCGPLQGVLEDKGTDWWYGAGVQYDGLRPLRVVGEYAVVSFETVGLESEVASIRLSLAYLF